MKTRIWGALMAATLVAGALTTIGAPAVAAESARATGGITIKVKKDQVKRGKKVVVTGKVTKNRKRITKVKLQQKRPGKKWRTQAVAKVNRKGRFKLKEFPTTATVRKYRVVSATGPKRRSAKVTVTVFEWRDLTRITPRQNSALSPVKQASIDAVSYGPAFRGGVWSSTGMIDFNLGRECTRLRARFGLGDDSNEDATATISVTADGKTVYSRSFGLTQSERRTIVLDPAAFRLGIAYNTGVSTDGSPDPVGAQAVIAEPEVRCSSR